MEEKERYKLESHNGTFCEFHDTETDEWYTRKDLVTDLLNQQDKRIKELEEQLSTATMYHGCETLVNELKQENKQLKQQLHDMPKKIVEDIKNQMGSIEDILINCGNGKGDALCWFNEILDTILKEY